MPHAGQIVILNGAPRSGKSTVARAVLDAADGAWVNLGVDSSLAGLPRRLRPGIGLRPGGEHPELEDLVVTLSAALYDSVAAHARRGLHVVVDVGHHDSYSRPLDILAGAARRLEGLPVLWVGVRCPLDVIWQRRRDTWDQDQATADDQLLAAVERWQVAVHDHDGYDMEVDTSTHSPSHCAHSILTRVADGPPGSAFARFARA